MSDLYKSETWLRRQYTVKRKTPQQIADDCGVGIATIYRWLTKFGLMR
jgi:DNA-binding MurR/RpiR family transcriptional regulator